jgi:Undecaprenyl-phosphate glucose phosphotransferase
VTKSNEYYLSQINRLTDQIGLNAAFFIGVVFRFYGEPSSLFDESAYWALLIFINLTWLLLSTNQKIYNRKFFASRNGYIFRVALVVSTLLIITIAFNGLIKTYYSRIFLFYTFLSFSFLLVIGRIISNSVFRNFLNKKAVKSAVVIVGEEIYQLEIDAFLQSEIDTEFEEIIRLTTVKELEQNLQNIKSKIEISELYIPLSKMPEEELEVISNYCDNNFISLKIIFDWKRISARKLVATKLSQTTVFKVTLTPLEEPSNAIAKRIFDVVFSSLVVLLILSWLLPIIAIAIKLSSKGSVFFTQKRTGLDNKEFNCYKFRSMKENELANLKQATQNDPRITKIGVFLRKTSLDELPQFINVLKGEMSIIGPRPHMLKHTEEYSKIVGNFMNRHAIKPGITGLAQIRGFRGEIDDLSLLQNRVRLDRFYVNNWTILFDLKIVFYTIITIFKAHK